MKPLVPGDTIQLLVPSMGGYKGQGIVLRGGSDPDDVLIYTRPDKPGATGRNIALRREVRKVTVTDPRLTQLDEVLEGLRLRPQERTKVRALLRTALYGPTMLTCFALDNSKFWYKVLLKAGAGAGAWLLDTGGEYFVSRKDDIARLITDMEQMTYHAIMYNWYRWGISEHDRPVGVLLLKYWCHLQNLPYRNYDMLRAQEADGTRNRGQAILFGTTQLSPSPPQKEPPMAVKLFRDAQGYAIQTEAPTEATFTAQLAQLLSQLIEDGVYDTHWSQVLLPWLTEAVNICCAYRGYKVDEVEQRTLYTAGRVPAQVGEPTHSIQDEPELLAQALRSNGATP